MKTNKIIGMCMLSILCLMFVSYNVSALGITPARQVLDFKPGLDETVNLKILNNEHRDLKLAVFVEGPLAEYVILSDSVVKMGSTESEKAISYRVKLPDKIDVPGRSENKIIIRELQPDKATSGVQIGGTVSVVSQLWIDVPYPGKYATTELKIAETGRTDRVDFIAVINSFGTQKIVSAKAVIDILGPTNEKIASIESEAIPIESGEKVELPLIWEGDINPGKYYAKLTVVYDGEIADYEMIFDVGSSDLEIIDMYVRDFSLGDIAKFNILVESKWAENFDDVYAEIRITDEDDIEVTTVKSASEDILALSKQELTAYWDTAGVKEGTYNMRLTLYYDGRTSQKEVTAFVSLTSIEFDLFGGTGAVTGAGGGFPKESLYVIGLIILVGLNIFWFFYFRKRKKKR